MTSSSYPPRVRGGSLDVVAYRAVASWRSFHTHLVKRWVLDAVAYRALASWHPFHTHLVRGGSLMLLPCAPSVNRKCRYEHQTPTSCQRWVWRKRQEPL